VSWTRSGEGKCSKICREEPIGSVKGPDEELNKKDAKEEGRRGRREQREERGREQKVGGGMRER
jgi:hypothetical protein